jgi:hypothetical protein
MKRIVYRRADGGTSIVTPNMNARLCRRATVDDRDYVFDPPVMVEQVAGEKLILHDVEGEDEFFARIIAETAPDAADISIVDHDDIPQDRTYRNALRPDLTFDMAQAREIHRTLMRRARQPKLDELDRLWMRATGQGDSASARLIEQARQQLRDVPAHASIDAARTVEELKNVWPEILGPMP